MLDTKDMPVIVTLFNLVSKVHASITLWSSTRSPSGMAGLTDPRSIQVFARAVHTNERVVMAVPHPDHLLDPYWLCGRKG